MTLIFVLIILPFAGSLIAACLPPSAHRREAWLAGLVTAAGVLITLLLFPQINTGEVIRYSLPWMPTLGLELVLRMDGLVWLFTLLIQGIGLLVVLYARYYLSPKDPVPRFYAFLLAFAGSMQGVVLSGNLIQLVVFWEMTSLSSFLLIGYWQHRSDARRGARMALTVTATGGFCLLAGVLLLGHITGSYDVDVIRAAAEQVRSHPAYLPTLVLIVIGALSKSAQFPFHFWLPHAMAAPTPVSAYLHSATMVKAGIFVLMLLSPVLSGSSAWFYLVAGAGACTLLIGAFFAIFQSDIKGLLAYSTLSHLGLITLLLGMGSTLGMVAAIFHTLNHAIFKASLFMAAGIIDHETGSRDIRRLSGLYLMLPVTATLAIVASASMAGVPLLNGFLSKEMFFAETLTIVGNSDWPLTLTALLMGIFSVAYSLRFISIFFGPAAHDLPRQAHEPAYWMRFPVELLVFLCLLVGVAPGATIAVPLQNAAYAVLGDTTPDYTLALWHGFNLPLMMSITALVIGTLFYIVLRRHYGLRYAHQVPLFHRVSVAVLFDRSLQMMADGSAALLRWLSARRLQAQMLAIMVALILLPWLVLDYRGLLTDLLTALHPADVDIAFALLWLIGGSCTLMSAWTARYHRLVSLTLLGGAGVATAMSFLWLSAPDLALTQLMVETVTIVLILLGLRWLPARTMPASGSASLLRLRGARDLLVAAACGLTMTLLSLAVLMSPMPENRIGDFFLLHALSEGGGSNVVNVLLVDFRALDTLGEISVLAIVALTVYALLRRFRPAAESVMLPQRRSGDIDPTAMLTPAQQAEYGFMMLPAVYLRFLLPFMGLIAVYFFFRGHNLPGGGFVAGLIFAVALIVQYMLAGTVWVEHRLRLQPHRWLVWGLLTAVLTGAGAWLLGYPFLTSHTAHLDLPVLGELHLPSAFLFDLGVFLVVVGATMLILVALSHQSLRSHRRVDGRATGGLRGWH